MSIFSYARGVKDAVAVVFAQELTEAIIEEAVSKVLSVVETTGARQESATVDEPTPSVEFEERT